MADRSSKDQATKDKIHKCKVCKTKFPDADSYIEHLESKDHQKGIMKEKYGKKYLEAKAKLDEKFNNDGTAAPEEKPKFDGTAAPEEKPKLISDMPISENNNTDEDSDDEVYTCEVCRKICTGFVSYQMHLKGQKHQKNLRKAKLMKQLHDNNSIPKIAEEKPPEEPSLLDRIMTKTKFASSPIECKTCNKSCSGPESFRQHCKSEKHLKKLALLGLLEDMKAEGISTKGLSDDTVFAHCDVCQKGFSGPLPYQQHMESVAHLKQERNVEQLSKIKDLVIPSEEDSKLQCKECNKVFSGPVPFNDHLKSFAHAKLKKKNAQMKALEQNHPGMVKIPIEDDSDNEDSEEDNAHLLGCSVCGLVCSGPQSARDHFESAKHKKAVKRKSRLEKYAKLQEGKKPGKVSGAKVSFEATKQEENKSSDSDDEFEVIPET